MDWSSDVCASDLDSDFAHAAGMGDVFAHGMLSMAWLAQMLTHWAPQERLRRWNVRFTAITPLHAPVTCRGEIVEIFEEAGERLARVNIGSWTDKEGQKHAGDDGVALAFIQGGRESVGEGKSVS